MPLYWREIQRQKRQKGIDVLERKILFGLTLPVSRQIRVELEQTAARKIPCLQSVCRYRKDGIYQYVKQQQENILIILEENLQGSSPYTADEVQQLTDLGNNRIIFLLDRCHYGDEYVHALYCCGVYDAVYLDEVSVDDVMKLIKEGRNCSQARDYYGITTLRDAERHRNIVSEECLNAYLECIEEGQGTEEIDSRYRFATTRLGTEENRILAGSITASVVRELVGNELYQFYKGGSKERHRWFPRRKCSRAQDTITLFKEEFDMSEVEQETERETREIVEGYEEMTESVVTAECEAEDMFDIMERFRRVATIEVDKFSAEIGEEDLLILMGNYLRAVDL